MTFEVLHLNRQWGWGERSKGAHRNKSRGAKQFLCPSTRSSYGGGGWQNLNCKFKTFGFLDTLKVYIQYNYLTSKLLYLSFKQN